MRFASYSGRPRLLTDAAVGTARAMKASGYSASQIAARLDVSKQTVLRRLSTPYKLKDRS